jgi:perosamine synthetase
MFATSNHFALDDFDAELHAEIREGIENLFRSGQWASYHAPVLDDLRRVIQESIGVDTIRLSASGSMAMELALRGCNLNEGDEVICPAIDYPGNIRAVRLLNASPVVVDCLQDRWTIDIDQVNLAASPKTKAVIASHLYGDAADVGRLRTLCDERGWILIEDACQMPGGDIAGKPLGSFGHVAAFSFGGSKPVTAGSGGAVVTDDQKIAMRIQSYVDRPSDAMALSPLQAATLLPQWRHLNRLVQRQQNKIAEFVSLCDKAIDRWSLPKTSSPDVSACFYKIPIGIAIEDNETQIESMRTRIVKRLTQSEVLAGMPFTPVTKIIQGRGRLVSNEHARRTSGKIFLLDHRNLAGSSERVASLAANLIAIHDEPF